MDVSVLPRRITVVVAFAAASLAIASSGIGAVHGQTPRPAPGQSPGQIPGQTPRFGVDPPSGEVAPPEAPTEPPPILSGPLLERPISRSEYVLGPADVLTLGIFGFRNETFSLPVTPEGSIVIPAVGVVRVGGLNLDQAEQAITRLVRRFNRDADVSVSLAMVRTFKIFVVGDVPHPGVREASAVTRVSELVPSRHPEGIIHRNVLLRRANGEAVRVDLARFLQLGDLSVNPTVREGDLIQVPAIDGTVSITGQVAFPGTYAFRPGESVADLLEVANGGGPFRTDAADTLRLMRFSDNRRGDILSVSQADILNGEGARVILEPFDAIFVPRRAHMRQRATATVEGEVNTPGVYPIQPGVTTVRTLLEMAGGFTPQASLVEAVLRREPIALPRDSIRFMENIPPELLSRDERRILQVTNRADDRSVVLNFQSLFEGDPGTLDVPLQDGDHIYVPEYRLEVMVLGAVPFPGILPFESGRSLEDYVTLAGGFSRRADRSNVVVIKARSGGRVHWRDIAALEPGDRIIIPFSEPLTFLERLSAVQSVMNTASGIVLTVFGLHRILF